MREIRLFVDAPLHVDTDIHLPEAAARHAVQVLRLRPSAEIGLFNGDGHQYSARLTVANPRSASARVVAMASPTRESPLHVTLLQALARGEKMDWIIQKATELGVARIVPVVSERSEVRLDPTRSSKRLAHWRAVVIAACEQSGRNLLPVIEAPVALTEWLAQAGHGDDVKARLMLHPGGTTGLRDLVCRPPSNYVRDSPPATPSANLALAVGPEGGFGDHDVTALRQAGYRAVTLGPRVLRTETAGIAALAALQALYGDF